MPQMIDLYSASVTPKQKNSLLAMYEDYLYFARGMERAMQVSNVVNMATWKLMQMYGSIKIEFPWKIEYASRYESQYYEDFVKVKPVKTSHYAYMSLNYTDLNKESKLPKILYIPDGYDVSNIDMELPSPVERYSVAFPINQKLGDSVFIIDGRFRAVYTQQKNADMSVAEAMIDDKTHTEFRILMNMVKHFDENPFSDEKAYVRQMTNIIASEAILPYENMMLESLASFADKADETCKSLFGGRSKDEYLKQAEKNGVISSAVVLQEYLDIRHLMRHQLDTLNSLGKFKPEAAAKNKQLRERYLTSYRHLCDKPVVGRIKNYIAATDHMRPLIQALYPNYLVRENSESNTHFMSRIKAFIKENQQVTPMIEVNYPLLSDKRKGLMSNLAKVAPNARVIDNIDISSTKFAEMEKDYQVRAEFLRNYNALECQMMSYCFLAAGLDCSNNEAWEQMRRRKFISYADYENIWKPLRQLRNELSHNHFNMALRNHLNNVVEKYLKASEQLNERISKQMPQVVHIENGVYEAVQSNGKRIKIDFDKRQLGQKKVLNRPDNGINRTKLQKKVHTEEFANGIGISLAGTEVVSCRLPNKFTIDMRRQRIEYPDGAVFYMSGDNINVLQTENSKIFTGKDFKVTKFLDHGERRQIRRNDSYIVDAHHQVATDGYGRISRMDFKKNTGQGVRMNFMFVPDATQINFSDGTKLEIKNGKFTLSHAGIELTPTTRQKFVAGYGSGGMVPPSNGGNGR